MSKRLIFAIAISLMLQQLLRDLEFDIFRARDLKTESTCKNMSGSSRCPPPPLPPLLAERSRFFPLVPSITKHPVCIESTMNALAGLTAFTTAAIKTPLVSFLVVPSSRTLSPSHPLRQPSFSSLLKAPSWSRRVRRLTEQKTIDRIRSLGIFRFPQK